MDAKGILFGKRREREGRREAVAMITSLANQKVKYVAQLRKKPALRRQEGVFLTEGVKMFLEAPEKMLEEVYVSEDVWKNGGMHSALWEKAYGKLERCGFETVSGEAFAKMSDTQSPQGILCIVRQQTYRLEDMIGKGERPFFLILENLQDPGNLGTILRTGEGAGVSGIIMDSDTVDIYNPKTVRATMGSIYRVPFLYTGHLHGAIRQMQRQGIKVYAAHLEGEQCYDECDYCRPTAFLIGNEGNGLTRETAGLADAYIRIPMAGQLESLNAAVAAALLLYAVEGQRRAVMR